jgi:hypothetical protein
MALVALSEFTDRLGRTLDVTETPRANAALEDASTVVLDAGDSTWTEVDVPDPVKTVVLAVARRVFENPEGATQKSVGDLSLSYGSNSDGGGRSQSALTLTSAERRTVRRAAGLTTSGSVTLVSPYTTS